jgi:hypothetical protein
MSSKPRRLAVLAVATTLAATGTAQAAPAQASAAARPTAHSAVLPEASRATPPASVTALARDLGVDTSFAWRTLDELARPSPQGVAGAKPTPHQSPHTR